MTVIRYNDLQFFCRVASDTRPDETYSIQWGVVEIDGIHKPYLTCPCKSFTTGKNQRGKDLHERECKHTLKAMLTNTARWNEILRQYNQVLIEPVVRSSKSDLTKTQSAGGLVRKVKR